MAKRWVPILEYMRPEVPRRRRRVSATPSVATVAMGFLIGVGIVALGAMLLNRPVLTTGGRSPDALVRADLANLGAVLDEFEVDCGRYPTTAEGLNALVKAPPGVAGWRGPYVKRGIPKDLWGNPYVYRGPSFGSSNYELLSKGPDGQEGTADDVIGSR